jgi:hypothetical protein
VPVTGSLEACTGVSVAVNVTLVPAITEGFEVTRAIVVELRLIVSVMETTATE